MVSKSRSILLSRAKSATTLNQNFVAALVDWGTALSSNAAFSNSETQTKREEQTSDIFQKRTNHEELEHARNRFLSASI